MWTQKGASEGACFGTMGLTCLFTICIDFADQKWGCKACFVDT